MANRSILPVSTRMLIGWLVAAIWLPLPAQAAGGALPSTFGSTVGSALLCKDHIDPYYFWSYLNQFVGAPYKTEGGAYWFKVQGSLWGAEITDVLVSDGKGQQIFLAAHFKGAPSKLAEAIAATAGVSYVKEDVTPYSPLKSSLGGKIVFVGSNSNIYCKQYNLDYSRR